MLSAIMSSLALAATYEVGPGKTYATINAAPIESLAAGDVLLIHWRATPYLETFGIERNTEGAAITVRGVLGPGGELPVIDGSGAVRGKNHHPRGVITVSANDVVIENLAVRSAHNSYLDSTGGTWATNASSIYAETGARLVFRNLELFDSANGMFSTFDTADVLVERCYIHGNGNTGSILEHNNYTESDGITFQFNRFGLLRSGARGVNLKDRSVNTVVRYNFIEGGNRTLDLVEPEGAPFESEATNAPTFVYGNVLIKGDEPNLNAQVVHFGGDNGDDAFYRRYLYFFHNTVYSVRSSATTLFHFDDDAPVIDMRNNIFDSSGSALRLVDSSTSSSSVITVSGNLIKTGWSLSAIGPLGTLSGTFATAENAEFLDAGTYDFRLASASPAKGIASALHANAADHLVTLQYVAHRAEQSRPTVAAAGALEDCANACAAPPGNTGTTGGTGSGSATGEGPGAEQPAPGAEDDDKATPAATAPKRGCAQTPPGSLLLVLFAYVLFRKPRMRRS